MPKHQSCRQCRRDFVGPDHDIDENLCPECEIEIHADCKAEIREIEADNARLQTLSETLMDGLHCTAIDLFALREAAKAVVDSGNRSYSVQADAIESLRIAIKGEEQ